ncbi:flagellar biosynthesis regulator FlaF [Caulobacter sp. 17J80-11]|uniref:flagellar biosynthesis regulator FlaF n=1 Tax=Caulobacter sp. 17J80-11 TaxID=2763502 RepID=UPI0016535F32|nr:flagellar biosynthesis regulator FlaF [Caulobacter sp. 17J80-11]MBC6980596.1 flagellar biosynthesis regulator FlaF [Caulobacter sp. 17J80-11]
MSLQAYQRAAQRAENPREAEYRLFGQVTRALMEAAKADPSDFKTRIEALDWNRRLWSTLATDCSDPANGQPDALRAQIISLSIWVNKHSSAVMRREEEFEPLIEINRIVMQGLSGGSSVQAA